MIEGIGRGQLPRAVPAVPAAPAAPAAPLSGGAEAGARVGRVGVGAAGLSGIGRELAAAPPVDAAKVERLRAAIAAGNYRADPDAIASAMMAGETIPPKG